MEQKKEIAPLEWSDVYEGPELRLWRRSPAQMLSTDDGVSAESRRERLTRRVALLKERLTQAALVMAGNGRSDAPGLSRSHRSAPTAPAAPLAAPKPGTCSQNQDY